MADFFSDQKQHAEMYKQDSFQPEGINYELLGVHQLWP